MKKNLSMLLMVLTLTVVCCWAVWVQCSHARDVEIEQANGSREILVNPAPPDMKDLNMLGLEPFTSRLPVIMLDSEGQQIMKETKRFGKVAVYDHGPDGNDILGAPTVILDCKMKIRGASSYNFDKPQFRINFLNEKRTKAMPYDLLGMGADSAWVLNAPYLDRSLMRNYLMYKLSGEIMDWAPDCKFCEVFVNGRYMGVYLVVEPINARAARLRISELGLLSGATGYIVARDRISTEKTPILPYGQRNGYTGNELGIRYPESDKITDRQIRWIENDISKFEQALYSDDFDDPKRGYANYIDMQSFADYFILNELSLNHDAGNLSTYVYKKLGDKIRLCVWDFNNGFDNYQWFTMPINQFGQTKNYWFDRLCQDYNFVDMVVKRYEQLRQTSLSDAHIAELLQQGIEEIGPEALERNFIRWGYTFQLGMLSSDDFGNSRDDTSHQQAMDRLERIIRERLDFMDNHMGDLYKNCIN